MSHPFEVHNRYHSQGLAAGGSALLDAINKGKVHLAKFILDAGEYDVVNTQDFNGKTPLIRVCYIKEEKTRDKAFQLLLNKGANVNHQDACGRTALSYACEMRCNDIVRILVKNNVDPDICDIKGNTPLMYSAAVGNDTAIEILIRSFRRLGLNINHLNSERQTALLLAARNGFLECATLLATEGRADVTLRDPETGRTAEEWARERGCTTQEVLPFAVLSAQSPQQLQKLQRQVRYGSIYNRLTAMQRLGPGYRDSDVNIDEDIDSLANGGDDGSSQLPVTSAHGANQQISCEAVTQGWRAVNANGCQATRRKRYSLPTIRLYSSLDSPGACYSGGPNATHQSAGKLQQSPLTIAQNEASIGNRNDDDGAVPNKLVNIHIALGARRSRELTRADTEVLLPSAMEDE